MRRSYLGFRKRSLGVVAFDSTRNRFLVAGDDFQLKFWDMDNTAVLCTLDADGGLPVRGRTEQSACHRAVQSEERAKEGGRGG